MSSHESTIFGRFAAPIVAEPSPEKCRVTNFFKRTWQDEIRPRATRMMGKVWRALRMRFSKVAPAQAKCHPVCLAEPEELLKVELHLKRVQGADEHHGAEDQHSA